MNKEEILKISRAQKEDEGVTYAENKGRRYGSIGFCSIFIIIVIFNLFTNHNNYVPYSLFFAYMATEAFGKYTISKNKSLIITTVFAAIASILFLACYIIDATGIAA